MGLRCTTRTFVKMAKSVMIQDISWYTDKKRVNDLKNSKNSSKSMKWKTHVESVKETVIEINENLIAEESIKKIG